MRCRIDLRGKQVLSPNYQESVLFNQLLSLTQDFQDALDLYAVSETAYFKEIYGKTEPSLKNLMIYVNSFETSPVSKTEVIEVLQSSGLTNSNDLLKALEKSEKEGIFIFTKSSLEKSGIFNKFTSENAIERQGYVQNLINYLRQNDDIIIQEFEYQETGSLNEIGQVKVEVIEKPVVFEGKISDINVLEPVFNEGLSNNISFIKNGIRETSWETMGTQVISILKEIEEQAVANGVDLKRLSDTYLTKSKQEVVSILDTVEQALSEEISEDELNIALNEYFSRSPITRSRDLRPSEILLKTDLTEEELYTQLELIKLSDNVFRNVINNTGRVFDTVKEEVDFLKDRLGINTYTHRQGTAKLEQFYGDYDYLTGDFILDFGQYLIETENEYFVIDEEGISLKDLREVDKALDSIPEDMLKDLEQYSLVSKNLTLPYEVESVPEYEVNEFQMERDKVIANPMLAKEVINFSYTLDGIAVPNSDDQFLRIGNTVFEITESEGNIGYYMELQKEFTLDVDKPVMSSERIPMKTSAKEKRIKETNNKNYKC